MPVQCWDTMHLQSVKFCIPNIQDRRQAPDLDLDATCPEVLGRKAETRQRKAMAGH